MENARCVQGVSCVEGFYWLIYSNLCSHWRDPCVYVYRWFFLSIQVSSTHAANLWYEHKAIFSEYHRHFPHFLVMLLSLLHQCLCLTYFIFGQPVKNCISFSISPEEHISQKRSSQSSPVYHAVSNLTSNMPALNFVKILLWDLERLLFTINFTWSKLWILVNVSSLLLVCASCSHFFLDCERSVLAIDVRSTGSL